MHCSQTKLSIEMFATITKCTSNWHIDINVYLVNVGDVCDDQRPSSMTDSAVHTSLTMKTQSR